MKPSSVFLHQTEMLSTLDILLGVKVSSTKKCQKIKLVVSIEHGLHCDLGKLIVKCYLESGLVVSLLNDSIDLEEKEMVSGSLLPGNSISK